MKLPPSHKLLKFCVTQSLLQAGFQKSSSSSLSSFTNVIEYLIYNLLHNLKDIPSDTALKYLLKYNLLRNDNVNNNDIFQLLKVCKGSGESVLHVMNIIPKNIDWRGKGGGVKVIKESGEVLESVYDDYVYEFIEEKSDEQNKDKHLEQNKEKHGDKHGEQHGDKHGDEVDIRGVVKKGDIEKNGEAERNIFGYTAESDNAIGNNNCNNTESIKGQSCIDEKKVCKDIEHRISSEIKSEQCKIMMYKNGSIICDSRMTCDDQIDTPINSNIQQNYIEQNGIEQNGIDEKLFCLDDLIVAVTNKKGWVNEKDYKHLLCSKKMKQSFLNCYESKFESNLIDEFKFLSCKEICKVQKKSKKDAE